MAEKLGDIAGRVVDMMPTITERQKKIIDAGAEILGHLEPEKSDLTFMARHFVQATLPHRSPPNNPPVFARNNGNYTLTVRPHYDKKSERYMYPYGSIPRLLLYWITTEALRTGKPTLELGDTIAAFMQDLGLNPYTGGGKRGDAQRLKDQMLRLFRSQISLDFDDRHQQSWADLRVTTKGQLWWDPLQPDQPSLFGSWIQLSEEFYGAITSKPIPLDMRALKALKGSPMALDIYAMSAYYMYRAKTSGKRQRLTWKQLGMYLGAGYSDPKNLKKAIQTALRSVQAVFPGMRIESMRGGIVYRPDGDLAVPTKVVALSKPDDAQTGES